MGPGAGEPADERMGMAATMTRISSGGGHPGIGR